MSRDGGMEAAGRKLIKVLQSFRSGFQPLALSPSCLPLPLSRSSHAVMIILKRFYNWIAGNRAWSP